MMQRRITWALCLAMALGGVSRGVDLQPVKTLDAPKAVTFGIDARDVDEMASAMAQSLLSSGRIVLDGTKTLALGPVDTDDCPYRFDERTMQEKIQTALHRSDKLQVSFAVDAMRDNTAAEARYGIMLFQWHKANAVDPRDLKTYGSLARVDYLLFGRVSAQTAVSGRRTEVTYTFNWKLGECETGLITWTDESERTKTGATPALPEWIASPRGDSALYLYELGQAKDARTEGDARAAALEDAGRRLLDRIGGPGASPADILLPLTEVSMTPVPGVMHETKGWAGFSCWVLARAERQEIGRHVTERQAAQQRWAKAEQLLERSRAAADGETRAGLLRDATRAYRELVAAYPVGAQSVIQSEHAAYRLAEIEKERNNPVAEQSWYAMVRDHSKSEEWVTKAGESLQTVAYDPADRETFLWRKEFDGRRVGVLCAIRLGDASESWAKLSGDLSAFLHGAGAVIVPLDAVPAGEVSGFAADPAAAQRLMRQRDLDLLLVMTATGQMNERAGQGGGAPASYQFSGAVRTDVLSPDKVLFSDHYNAVTGWNPVGRAMCLDVLSVHVLRKWKSPYLKYLEQSP